jgi:RNA polymerase-binding protein DksA
MEKKRIDTDKLTPADLKKFKAILMAKRNEILGAVTSMEDEALKKDNSEFSNMPTHLADLGTDNFDQEFTLGLMENERKLLREINDALNRIEEGAYGICQGSGKPIPKARLKAIPWTRYCVEYASMLEKGLVKDHSEPNVTDSGYDYGYGDDEQDEGPSEPFKRKAI